jgi:hypothetical protein
MPDDAKIKWSLANTFVTVKLDLSNDEDDHFSTWKRQVKSFFRASGLQEASWEDQQAGLEITTDRESFKQISAIHQQLPTGDQENFEKLLEVVEKACGTSTSVWVYRRDFSLLVQQQGQPFRAFFNNIKTLACKCGFSKGYCENDKRKALEDQILSRVVFGTTNSVARQKQQILLLRKPQR